MENISKNEIWYLETIIELKMFLCKIMKRNKENKIYILIELRRYFSVFNPENSGILSKLFKN